MAITKALSDPNRVRILLALQKGELCVCQITELFGFAPSTISKHLSILHHGGLILSRKSERWVYYRLPGKEAPAPVRAGFFWVSKAIENDDGVQSDARQLKKILRIDPTELCQRQCPK